MLITFLLIAPMAASMLFVFGAHVDPLTARITRQSRRDILNVLTHIDGVGGICLLGPLRNFAKALLLWFRRNSPRGVRIAI